MELGHHHPPVLAGIGHSHFQIRPLSTPAQLFDRARPLLRSPLCLPKRLGTGCSQLFEIEGRSKTKYLRRSPPPLRKP